MLTPEQLARVCAATVPDAARYCEYLNAAMDYYDINTRARAAMFLAQGSYESARFSRCEENLSYSSPERIQLIFGRKRFPSLDSARPFVRNPKGLANRVYANRFGNGDEVSGDGWRFRGRGIFQLTFHDNYLAAANGTGLSLIEDPDQVAHSAEAAAWTAAWYWYSRDCNSSADAHDIHRNTVSINGGTHGLEDGNNDGRLDDRTEMYEYAVAQLDSIGVFP